MVSAQEPVAGNGGTGVGLMRHGILVVSRSEGILPLGKMFLAYLKVTNVWGTMLDGEALTMLINKEKPHLIIMEASFYKTATPYMIGMLLENMPFLRIAVFNLGEYPAHIEPYFILNGAESYVSLRNGMAEFYRGMRKILKGETYIASHVQRQMAHMKEYTEKLPKRWRREKEVLVLLSEGATTKDICDTLKISAKTVDNHKEHLFKRFNAKNAMQTVGTALRLEELDIQEFMGVVNADKKQERGIPDRE
jgi:DNA-binding NarL/FixJ family response regulator